MITDRRKLTTKWSLHWMSFPFLPLESIQNHPLCVRSVQDTDQIFGNVRCPILGKPVRHCAAWRADMEEKQTELETENK